MDRPKFELADIFRRYTPESSAWFRAYDKLPAFCRVSGCDSANQRFQFQTGCQIPTGMGSFKAPATVFGREKFRAAFLVSQQSDNVPLSKVEMSP